MNDTIEAQLPAEQAGFRKGRCTQDQVLKLTQDIEASFDDGDKVGAVLVDLMAAYDTVWHTGLKLNPFSYFKKWSSESLVEKTTYSIWATD